MSILKTAVIKNFIRLSTDGWEQGWHERNGGNLTYRMQTQEAEQCRQYFSTEEQGWVPLGVSAPNLAGECFIATGSGKFFRNVILQPQNALCIVEINQTGDAYRLAWGLEEGGKPTSEFESHFLNHSVRKAATNGTCRVIYHAHPTNIIAMTYLLPLTDRDFTRALWQSATECPVVFPAGVGVLEWMVPGGSEIAVKTSELMQAYDAVVWAHHGLFCAGPDFNTTFGLMHTIEKAAEIYMRVAGCGGIRQTITDTNLKAIAAAFGVELNRAFID